MSALRIGNFALGLVASAMLFGCASTTTTRELTAARSAMGEAYATPMVKSAEVELADAEIALARAEKLQADHPGSLEAKDAAYVAMRMAERARVAALYAADADALATAQASVDRLYQDVAKKDREDREHSALEHAAKERAVGELRTLRSAVERAAGGADVVKGAGPKTSVGIPVASLFVEKSAVLTTKGKAQLIALASAMREGPPVDVRVRVTELEHATGADDSLLARRRADRVTEALREAGLPSDYLTEPESRPGSEQRVDLLMTEKPIVVPPISVALPAPSASR